MFLNSWSIALCLISLVVVFLLLLAARTAVRVLRYWDLASDSNLQISLENETWLASTMVKYALAFQIFSLFLFAMAADAFSDVVAGAMCATGSLTVNDYGMPALYIKMLGLFIYGFWLVIHNLDVSSESYPLLKLKFVYLVLLLPWVVVDIGMQTLYIANLKPDIITSCCAVVFGEGGGKGMNLLGPFSKGIGLPLFYGTALLLFICGIVLRRRWRPWLANCYGLVWALFLPFSLLVITSIISSYIYAMPYHRCPFCILKPEYHYIGFFIYGTLFPGSFFAVSAALVGFFRKRPDLGEFVTKFQRVAVLISLGMLLAFICFSSYDYLYYKIFL